MFVFGIPVAPSLSANYPGGDEALDQLFDQAAVEVFEPAGATYVGMMKSIDDDRFWYDVVHPNEEGGIAMSLELSTALSEFGL